MIINFKTGGKILEIGGGANPLINPNGKRVTFNMDIVEHENVDLVYDINKIPLPFENESFDGIFSRYCAEHIEWRNIPVFLKECLRILRPNGKAIFFVPNTYEQCKRVVEEGINDGTIEMLFGSQEFPNFGGCHKTGFSPEYAKKLFLKNGFNNVIIMKHPNTNTDMIIEAYKLGKKELFEREYFEDGTIGYSEYRDFATHHSTARVIKSIGAKNILDIGAGRGYIVKLLENMGLNAIGMDISHHCYMTRATDNLKLHDATVLPWPFKDKEFDLSFSINFLEHIPEKYIDNVIKESIRVSKAGFHGIHLDKSPFKEMDEDKDITHFTLHNQEWWEQKFKEIDPDYEVVLKHPRYLEYEKPEQQPPITLMPATTDTDIKLNLGSFKDMFYYGWKNIDIIDLDFFSKSQSYKFIQHDLTKNIPFENDTVSLIISNHMIEHITRDEGKKLLKECYRVMKKDGIIRISTPDTKIITQKYIDGKIREYKYINVGVETADDDAEAYYNLLLAGHFTIYDEESLIKMMKNIGFKNVERKTPFESKSKKIQQETITTHPNISLVIEGIK